ncbi:sulfite exporter TauE/SafE family protein [Coleofasciculus sp. FACHB-1120]|uniref:sulfite exporter TauE/SafE family protein n=1 Tax=Coleofasciculus sp. FACHB-1120 TaxID=2692783 RepID=UPI0016889BAC|nr:sulfite exporter TauE/SafE family protein [Coleofasciculus sp. FACHB-1120]MBD2742175.1 sulfite exporter TauE/SafE family protein [Coleofasciculus sp. FACHB-1120]
MSTLLLLLLLIGLIAGLAGGLFGIGGGSIMVPAMVWLLGLDQKIATGTSIAAQILPIGILGAIVYYRNNNLSIQYALIIAIGLVVGNLLGALLVNQPFMFLFTSGDTMKKLYGLLLLVIGLQYLLRR